MLAYRQTPWIFSTSIEDVTGWVVTAVLKSCCYFADDTLIRLKFPWREGRQIKGLSSCPSLPHLHSHKGCFQLCPSDAGALPSLATQASNVKRELPARPPHHELPALFCVSRCSARSSSGSLSGLAGAQGGAPSDSPEQVWVQLEDSCPVLQGACRADSRSSGVRGLERDPRWTVSPVRPLWSVPGVAPHRWKEPHTWLLGDCTRRWFHWRRLL